MTAPPKPNGGPRVEPVTVFAVGFLLLALALGLAGLHLFGCREAEAFWSWMGPCPEDGISTAAGLYALETRLIAASVISTAVGLELVSELTRGTSGLGPAKVGASLYMFGGFLVVAVGLALADGTMLPGAESLVVGYVVLAFLGQAAAGWGLIKGVTGLKVVGWITIVFNLGLLIVLSLVSRDDMYFPVVHMVMPAVIAVALIARRRSPNKWESTL